MRMLVADEARREAIRKAARVRALEMSWDRIFDDVCRGYASAITLAASQRREHGPAVVTDANAPGAATGR